MTQTPMQPRRVPPALVTLVATVLVAAPSLAADSFRLPHVAVGDVLLPDGSPGPDGLVWSTWPRDATERRVGTERMLAVTDGRFVGDLSVGESGEALAETWVVLVEGPTVAGSAFAITRSTLHGTPASFPAATLLPVPVPALEQERQRVTLTWDAPRLEDRAFAAGDGLEGYAVLRAGLDRRWVEVGRVAAGPGEHAFTDEAVPVGYWTYALAVVAEGGVASEVRAVGGTVAVGFEDLEARPRPRDEDGLRRPALDGRRGR